MANKIKRSLLRDSTRDLGTSVYGYTPLLIGYNAKKSKVSHLLQFHGPKLDPGIGGM